MEMVTAGRWNENLVEDWMDQAGMLEAYEQLDMSEELYTKVDAFMNTFFEKDDDYPMM